jgi:hypothetical protein
MQSSIKIAPPNSLFFISDSTGGETPKIAKGPRIWSTKTCIAIGCLAFMDGETEISLGSVQEVDPGGEPAFDGVLETPNHRVVISTVERKVLLNSPVNGSHTRVRVWVNHPKEPDKIQIGLG